jgi:hypothetical protein
MIKDNVNKVKKLYDNNNNGKSVNVNRVIVEYWDDISEAVIILDSDICQKDDMMMLYNLYKEQNQFEMLLPNYFEDVRHNFKSIDCCTEINEKKIQFQSTFSYFGFSGGVMITSKCILKRFPFENVGRYGPEDTYMFRNLFVNRKKVGLVSNFYVIHPFEEDKAWLEEKYEILKQRFMKVLERK